MSENLDFSVRKGGREKVSGSWDVQDQVRDFLGKEETVSTNTKPIKLKLAGWMYNSIQGVFPSRKPYVWLLSCLAELMYENGVELVLKSVEELEVELIGAGYELPAYYRTDLPESEISCVLNHVRPALIEIDREIDEREEERQKFQEFIERYR